MPTPYSNLMANRVKISLTDGTGTEITCGVNENVGRCINEWRRGWIKRSEIKSYEIVERDVDFAKINGA